MPDPRDPTPASADPSSSTALVVRGPARELVPAPARAIAGGELLEFERAGDAIGIVATWAGRAAAHET